MPFVAARAGERERIDGVGAFIADSYYTIGCRYFVTGNGLDFWPESYLAAIFIFGAGSARE